MALLADWVLAVNGESLGTSWPEGGDVSSAEHGGHRRCRPPKLSFGVSARDAARLEPLTGEVVRVIDINERELIRLQIEKVDPELNILVGIPLAEERR